MSYRDAGLFFSDYAAWLWGCGATSIRLEKNVRRMAEAWGMRVDMSIMPTHVYTTVWNAAQTESLCMVRRMHKSAISFEQNARLSALSWDIAEGRYGWEKALSVFEEIKQTRPVCPWTVAGLVAVANASFCHLFGGDGVSMLIVLGSTFFGFRIKQMMLDDGADVRVAILCASFFSAVASAGGHLFGWGHTPETALASSVLYLIPGIPYINSVSDMLNGHYVCAFSRFMDSVVLTACLSLGFCLGLLMLHLEWLK